MLRHEVRIVYDGVEFQIGFFTEGALIHYEAVQVMDLPSIQLFLLTGHLPG